MFCSADCFVRLLCSFSSVAASFPSFNSSESLHQQMTMFSLYPYSLVQQGVLDVVTRVFLSRERGARGNVRSTCRLTNRKSAAATGQLRLASSSTTGYMCVLPRLKSQQQLGSHGQIKVGSAVETGVCVCVCVEWQVSSDKYCWTHLVVGATCRCMAGAPWLLCTALVDSTI